MAMSKPNIPMNPALINSAASFAMTEERSARSIFVGNIPYDTSEELLKSIFNQAGNVISFKMVYDRETGKPKGYGFCEYQDQEMANSAMRNLNNYEINGRQLRVGVAVGDQINEARAIFAPPSESPYGEVMEPEKAPEAISKAVASLPPEQMFELMKQMKICIQNNPNEARHMLLQNPQLAYALLQAQIVMKIVDPQVALAMLYRPVEQIPPILPAANGDKLPAPPIMANQLQGPPRPEKPDFGRGVNMGTMRPRGGLLGDMPAQLPNFIQEDNGMDTGFQSDIHNFSEIRPNLGPWPDKIGLNYAPRTDFQGPRSDYQSPRPDHHGQRPDYFGPRGDIRPGPSKPPFRPGHRQELGAYGPRPEMDMNMRPMGPKEGRFLGPGPMGREEPIEGRSMGDVDSRNPRINKNNESSALGTKITPQDHEKAALIMQVLQLTDEQISMLPQDQRQSILILKEQIAKSSIL